MVKVTIFLALFYSFGRQFFDESIEGLRYGDPPVRKYPGQIFHDDEIDFPFGVELEEVDYEHYECELEECETI